MERFLIELARWPPRQVVQNVSLSNKGLCSTRAMSRCGEIVFEMQIGANTYKENSSPVLGHSKILSVQNRPLDLVTGHSVTAQLILKKCPTLPECHAVDILNYEGLRFYLSKDSVEFLIKEINCVVPVPLPTLAIALARITASQKICLREFVEACDVALFNSRITEIVLIGFASRLPNVIGPNYPVSRALQSQI
ncbi:MAG: hypothetical protein WCD49_12395 [Candidatus Acidiferrales bacterium]